MKRPQGRGPESNVAALGAEQSPGPGADARSHVGYQTTSGTKLNAPKRTKAELGAPQRAQITSIWLANAISHPGGRRFESG
jgi:hypothetical protein